MFDFGSSPALAPGNGTSQKRTLLAEAEALLQTHGLPYRRHSPHHLRVLDINVYSSGKIHVDGADKSLPNAGAKGLARLLKERGVLGRGAGGGREGAHAADGHPRTDGARERRALELRAERLAAAGERLARERDEALAGLRRAEGRLAAKSAEYDALQAELRQRGAADAGARPARDGAGDDKFRAAKRTFAKDFHPDRIPAGGVERTVREEVFKKYWAVLQRIEKA